MIKPILLSLISISLISVPPVDCLKGTWDNLSDFKRKFTIFRAAVLWESKTIQNVCLYRNANSSKMAALIKNNSCGFFHVIPGTTNVNPSTAPGNPTRFLLEKNLHANLMCMLHTKNFEDAEFRNALLSCGMRNANVNKLIKSLKEAQKEEEEGLFPQGTTMEIVMAHLYASTNSKEAIALYQEKIKQFIPELR